MYLFVCGTQPNIVTLSINSSCSRTCSSSTRFGPSPPTMKFTCGYALHIAGIRWTSKSTPFRNTSLLMTTIVILPSSRRFVSVTVHARRKRAGISVGTKTLVSTALGITDIRCGGNLARNAVFSLLVCETHIACAIFFKLYLKSLFVNMAEASLHVRQNDIVIRIEHTCQHMSASN